MGMYLNPGNGMFQNTLNGRFYVDKTGLVSFMNERLCSPEKFVCISRPRRFGKSVDADMLVAYYTRGIDSRAQFEGLEIARDPSFEQHLNAHDVIKIDVQRSMGLAGTTPDKFVAALTAEIIPELHAIWPDVVPKEDITLAKALTLAFLEKGTGFIFVIDEWDFIMREAQDDEQTQNAYLDFLRDLFKGAPYVEAVYMTGILPIRKYGKHSALNIFTEYSVTDPKDIPHLFGFNASEVERLCEEFSMDYTEMAYWYDGYLLGSERIHVYNPRSVSGAISTGKYSSFWTDTETYEALQVYIDMDYEGVASDLLAMLDGAKLPARIEGFTNTMTEFRDKDDVYTLLVHLGYLGYDQVERAVFIPNEEIRREYVNALRGGTRLGLARLIGESRELITQTIEANCAYVADALDRAHTWAATPLHYNSEQALRAAIKFAYIAAIDDYLRIDELPGGKGFADLVFIPKPGSTLPPLVVELKWNDTADAALAQIYARNYPAALAGLSGECLLVGVTYDTNTKDHSCQIERIRLSGF